MIKQLFCSHEYKVLSEHTETYQEPVNEIRYGRQCTVTDFWGQAFVRTRTSKTVILTCPKCGKNKTHIL